MVILNDQLEEEREGRQDDRKVQCKFIDTDLGDIKEIKSLESDHNPYYDYNHHIFIINFCDT